MSDCNQRNSAKLDRERVLAGVPHELDSDHKGRSDVGQFADLLGRAVTRPFHGIPNAKGGQEGRHDHHEPATLCRVDVHHLRQRRLDALPGEAVKRFCHRIVLGKEGVISYHSVKSLTVKGQKGQGERISPSLAEKKKQTFTYFQCWKRNIIWYSER